METERTPDAPTAARTEEHPPPIPGPEEARALLEARGAVADRAALRPPPRSLAWLQLGSAISLTIVMAACLVLVDSPTVPQAFGLVLPVVVAPALIDGAGERYGTRTRRSLRERLTGAAALLAVVVAIVIRILGTQYPWWINIVLVAAVLAAFATDPVRTLRTAPRTEAAWPRHRLSLQARTITCVIGAAFGTVIATAPLPAASFALSVGFFVLMGGFLATMWSRWGLPRTGYEWWPAHWVIAAVGAILVPIALLAAAWVSGVSEWAWVGTGAAVCAVFIAGALLPSRRPADA